MAESSQGVAEAHSAYQHGSGSMRGNFVPNGAVLFPLSIV